MALKKKRSVKRKTPPRKKVIKKRSAKKKVVKRNPVKGPYYVAFITVGKNNDKFYYHGINYKTKGLRFSTGTKTPIVFTSRKEAIKFVEEMVMAFVPEQKKELFPIGAELHRPK